MNRRLIEKTFPIKEISKECVREKRIRKGHISSLHVWWARRPLTASRVTIFSSFIKDLENGTNSVEPNEIVKLSKWESGIDKTIIEKARKKILSNKNKKFKILDPFAGGGSIPFEAQRLGFETYALDYNPVATCILKCVLEFPQKFISDKKGFIDSRKNNLLLDGIKKWGEWIQNETEKEIGKFYSTTKNDETVVGYVWNKTISCQNPKCGAEIPLSRSYYLYKKNKRVVVLYPFIKNKKVEFKILDSEKNKIPKDFDPNVGSIHSAKAKCFVCNSMIDSNQTRQLFFDKKTNEKLIAVISYKKGKTGKIYRIADNEDLKQFKKTEDFLKKKIEQIKTQEGIDPLPSEELPPPGGLGFRVQRYGMTKWTDLFNSRQKLALIVFSEKVRKAFDILISEGEDEEFAKALVAYLALGVDRLANYGSTLCYLNPTGGRGVANTFGRHVLSMVPNYAESNPFNPEGASWIKACESIEAWLERALTVESNPSVVNQSSATNIPYDNDFFDGVFTDPPYYDMIAYAGLSDFFYVWLKRMLGNIFPDVFMTPLTPKSKEIVAHPNTENKSPKEYFEKLLIQSFIEIHRVLKFDGIAVIVYGHKSTDGWETLIKSLLNSGLVVTAAWPIHTEMQGRLEAQETASLASSIYMVCRKWKKEPIGFYREIKKEMKKYLKKKLEQLWNEGISGADFFISAIGSAIEVFGKYDKIIDDKDKEVSILKLLNDTRTIVTDYAINKVIKGEFSEEISQMTRFYILWRWAYGEAKAPFDNGSKMALSVGIDIEHEWNKGFIVKDKELIHVLGPNERNEKELDESQDLIDILHKALLIWKKEKREAVEKFLEEKGYGNSEVFKRIAQAISESLPVESTEKKWLDGFLTGYRAGATQSEIQSKLF
ncbi:Site-specific DNA-methyltransferase Type III restriction system mod subunit protein [Marine Group I thaumarchaeote SCGC AAA799-P11]|uniref:site-specific DNA-methyltransferase (adenine-specific) n=1 Tax=Marine Group I thaumarchaeote SCGC AAA799-P11 TaxID=1502295 RepID=A0A087S379_9ARCH|nr:Site-specific DNA-methyltransferase Type III restriction system mod subunit protein [Marine Group I thaumarchaeote SCGC AAA799-P11]